MRDRKFSEVVYVGLEMTDFPTAIRHHHHHHKHQGLDPLIRSVSKVTTALSNVSSVFQLFSSLMVCSSVISKGFCLKSYYYRPQGRRTFFILILAFRDSYKFWVLKSTKKSLKMKIIKICTILHTKYTLDKCESTY